MTITKGPCPFCDAKFTSEWLKHLEQCDIYRANCYSYHCPPIRVIIIDADKNKVYRLYKLNESWSSPSEISVSEATGHLERRASSIRMTLAHLTRGVKMLNDIEAQQKGVNND